MGHSDVRARGRACGRAAPQRRLSLYACRRARQPLELDFTQVLPAGWAAAGAWQEVNLDGDAGVEYLLLFTFDQGQVGAAIFDSQIASDVVGVVSASATPAVALYPVPLQPFGYFRPYRLLPSYWSYTYGGAAGQGVVAMPRDKDNLLAIQVGGPAPAESADREASAQPAAELVIRGGDTHLTFVWWRNAQYGYGVTQLAAEGGFRGVDWATWQKNPLPIEEIAGLYPLTDYRAVARSAAKSSTSAVRLCRQAAKRLAVAPKLAASCP